MKLAEIDAPNIVVNGTVRDLSADAAEQQGPYVSGSNKLLTRYVAAFS